MNTILKQLKDIQSNCCVSILLNTHRTRPDNEKDVIVLKNLVKEAKERLANDYDKSFAKGIIERMEALAAGIEHDQNQESLALFINEDIAEYVRLPVNAANRVVVDQTFATRDLVRAMHQEEIYYVLVLSRDIARLIEAANDKVVEEKSDPFPFQNESLYASNRLQSSTRQGQDNLIEEFFNRVDKAFQEVWAESPLPLVVCTEERNFYHYKKVTDNPASIIGHLGQGRTDEKAHHIVAKAWPIVFQWNKQRNSQRLSELRQAINTGKFLSDMNDIWTAVNAGRGQTLFVQKGLFQPAKIVDNKIILVDDSRTTEKGVVDDIIDEMIEYNENHNGNTVFLDKEELTKVNGLALITRY